MMVILVSVMIEIIITNYGRNLTTKNGVKSYKQLSGNRILAGFQRTLITCFYC